MLIRESTLRRIIRQEIMNEVTQADLIGMINDQLKAGGGASVSSGSTTAIPGTPITGAVGPNFPPAKYNGAWQALVGSAEPPGTTGYVKEFWDPIQQRVSEIQEKLGTLTGALQVGRAVDNIAQLGSKHPLAPTLLSIIDAGGSPGDVVIELSYCMLTRKTSTRSYHATQYFAQPDPQYWKGTEKLKEVANQLAGVAGNVIRNLKIILSMDPSTFTKQPTPGPTPTPTPEPPPPPPNPNPVQVVNTGLTTAVWLKNNGIQNNYPGRYKDMPCYVLGTDPARTPKAGQTILGPFGDPFVYAEAGGGKLKVMGGPVKRSIGAVFTHTQTRRSYPPSRK